MHRDSRAGSYGAALILGIAAVAWIFPAWTLLGGLPPGAPLGPDFATHVIGQRYFFAAPWHWPILTAPGPDAPHGVNIAFTDSIPLASLLAKLMRPALPPFDQVITLWQALCWLLQPAAAIFALRSAGERRLWTALCIAPMALVQPVFVTRFRHAALCSHFTILLMLGLYLRIVSGSRRALVAACLIEPLTLLIHPYLAAMNGAVLAAAPLTLLLRRDPAWRVAAAGVVFSAGAIVVLSVMLGYTEGVSEGGFGFFSMNLAGPFYPAGSAFLPWLPFGPVDATGGQIDAPAYLGAGLLLLLGCIVFAAKGSVMDQIRRHAGLVLCCAVLLALALSNKIFLFHTLIFRLHVHFPFLEPLRASGRMFWPVTYVLLIGGTVILLRAQPRLARTLLPLVVTLQVTDGRGLLLATHFRLRDPVPWLFDPARMRDLTKGATSLTILPIYGCNLTRDDQLMQPLWIASETLLPTNTMYAARLRDKPDCRLASQLAHGPAPGELLVMQPGFAPLIAAEPYAAACRLLSGYAVCMQDQSRFQGLQPLRPSG